MTASKPFCGMNEGNPQATLTEPPEARTEGDSGPYAVWIKTKELGWFRSAVRGTEEAANRLANELRKNFKEVEVR